MPQNWIKQNEQVIQPPFVPQDVSYQAPLEGSRYHITKEQLEFLIDCHMTIRQMADVLNVSHSVVKRRTRWRIVIRGAVDGYSRRVFLKDSDNNRSATVMESFKAAITSYGVPSRKGTIDIFNSKRMGTRV
ncbi:uncharacterized protein ACWYII_032863 [Salvelinus alpinus]